MRGITRAILLIAALGAIAASVAGARPPSGRTSLLTARGTSGEILKLADASVTLPAGNAVQQWDQLAADTVVKSGTTQMEGFQYMAYVSGTVYNAVVSIQGGYKSWGPRIKSARGASADAAT